MVASIMCRVDWIQHRNLDLRFDDRSQRPYTASSTQISTQDVLNGFVFPVGPISHYDFQRRCLEPVDFLIVCCRKRHEQTFSSTLIKD